MTGPAPAVAATRSAVRAVLTETGGLPLFVACSGGADSLALAAATAFEAPRAGRSAGAVVVDHGLQAGSDRAARAAARECRRLGLDPVRVVRAVVSPEVPGGPEARARAARYTALAAAAGEGSAVLLGHTRDDQAEQVLLGLSRGSGSRSLAGMPRCRPPFHRPFLDLRHATTAAACAAQGLRPWADPHNADDAFTRVRARRLLREFERALGPGVVDALARSADLCRADADALDEFADAAAAALGPPPWPVETMLRHPAAVRTRLWRRLALAAGCPAGDLAAAHLWAVDALVARWSDQGPVHLPGGRLARRVAGVVHITGPGSY